MGALVLRVAHGGANWVLAPIVLAILCVGLAGPFGAPWLVQLSSVPFFLTLFMLWFFRDPDRPLATGMVCPADGKVQRIDQVDDPDLGPCDRLSIFMRVSDIHVNRSPVSGDVRSVTHRPGKHVPAFNKDSDRNEQVQTIIQTRHGKVKVVQIAGAVARRIVPYAERGDHIDAGDRIGLIRLGSRCDVLVPTDVQHGAWEVQEGQRVWAGRTCIAEGPWAS